MKTDTTTVYSVFIEPIPLPGGLDLPRPGERGTSVGIDWAAWSLSCDVVHRRIMVTLWVSVLVCVALTRFVCRYNIRGSLGDGTEEL